MLAATTTQGCGAKRAGRDYSAAASAGVIFGQSSQSCRPAEGRSTRSGCFAICDNYLSLHDRSVSPLSTIGAALRFRYFCRNIPIHRPLGGRDGRDPACYCCRIDRREHLHGFHLAPRATEPSQSTRLTRVQVMGRTCLIKWSIAALVLGGLLLTRQPHANPIDQVAGQPQRCGIVTCEM